MSVALFVRDPDFLAFLYGPINLLNVKWQTLIHLKVIQIPNHKVLA